MTAPRRTRRGPCPAAPRRCGRRSPASAAAIGYLVGGQDYHDRMRTEAFCAGGPEALGGTEAGLEPPGRSRRRGGRPCHLFGWLRPSARGAGQRHRQRHAPGSRRRIEDKRRARSDRQGSVKPQLLRQLAANTWRAQMERREALKAAAAERGVAVPDLGRLRHMAGRDRLCGGSLRGTHGRPGKLRHPPRLRRARGERASVQRSHAGARRA